MSYSADFEHEALDVGDLVTAELNKVSDLLDALKLSRWTNKFNEESIDLPTLFFVQDEQLMALGLSLSERIKLLRCVQLLKDVPPPPASMSMKWKKEPPSRPTPRVRFEEKVEEVSAAAIGENGDEAYIPEHQEDDVSEVKDEYESEQQSEPQEHEEEPAEEDRHSYEVPAAIGAAVAASAAALAGAAIASNAMEESFTPAHSRVYICCDKDDQAERICDALQAAFEDELGLNQGQVKFLVPEEPAHITMGLESTLEESLPTDDLLWVILAFNGADDELVPGVSFSQLVESVERRYKGRRVIFVVDSCVVPHLAESDASMLNEKLEMALLYTVSPVAPNPCFLCLCLVHALKGNVFARPNERFTLKHFVDDALDSVRFVGRCLERPDTVSEYIATPGFVDEDLDMFPPRASVLASANPSCGMRGVYASERPVQVIEMNGRERAHVRFLDDLSDPEWVDLAEVVASHDSTAVDASEQEESGRDVPLPVPPALYESAVEGTESEDAAGEEGESGRDMPLPVPPVDGEQVAEEEDVSGALATEEMMEEMVDNSMPVEETEAATVEELAATEEFASTEFAIEEGMEQAPMEEEQLVEAQQEEEVELADAEQAYEETPQEAFEGELATEDMAMEAAAEPEPIAEHESVEVAAVEDMHEVAAEEAPLEVEASALGETHEFDEAVIEEAQPLEKATVNEEEEAQPVEEEVAVEEEDHQLEEVAMEEDQLLEEVAMEEEETTANAGSGRNFGIAPPPPAIRSDSILSEHSSARELPVASVATMEELEEIPIDDTPDMEGINDIVPDMDMLHEEIILDDDLLDMVEGDEDPDATKAT